MITKILYYILVLPISLLPLPILYLFSDILYLIIYKCIGYRKAVVFTNLKKSFPEKSEKEIIQIKTDFFKHFFDLIVEIIKMISAGKSFLNKRVTITNAELINNYAEKKQTIILVFGHFNNWEWVGQKLSISAKQKVVGIYKPLNNTSFDSLLKKARTKFGAIAVSMEESMRYILNTKTETQIIGIIADQNPVVNPTTKWHPFFGREVPVFMGAEKIAKKMDYPLVFCDMQKIGSGEYTITFEHLVENPKETLEGEITKRYFERLEKQISQIPSQWLWSHKRWKHKR